MRIGVILSFFAIGAIAATPVDKLAAPVKRDLATITGVINSINQQAIGLETTVKAYSGGDASTLTSAANTLLDVINSGQTKIAATSPISLTEALTVQSAVNTLSSTINSTISSLLGKQDLLAQAGLAATVLSALQSQGSASSALASAIVSKVPTAVQGVAQQVAAGVTDAIGRGIAAFSGAAGTSGAAGSVSATPSASASGSQVTAAPSASTTGTTTRNAGGALATRTATRLTGAASVPTGHIGAGIAFAAAALAAAAL